MRLLIAVLTVLTLSAPALAQQVADQIAGPQKTRIGFNAPDAPRNKVFVLNVARWLAGVLE